jgi:hypothetical protein
MKGDGDHQEIIAKGKIRIPIVRQEIAQRLCQTGVSPIFEPGDDFRQEALIMGEGSGLGEMPVSPETVRAQMVLPKVAGKADAAAGTAGVGHLADLAEASGADPRGIFIFPVFTAKGAARGEEKIDQGMPPGGHFYVLKG